MTDQEKARIIIREVCRYYNTTERELKSRCRERRLVESRHFIYYFCRDFTGMSLQTIGNLFKQDHASVLHACNLIPDLIRFNGYGQKAMKLRSNIQSVIGQDEIEKWVLSIGQL